MTDLKKEEEFKANFLYPPKTELDSLLYEFANASTEEYRQLQHEKLCLLISEKLADHDREIVEKIEGKKLELVSHESESEAIRKHIHNSAIDTIITTLTQGNKDL